MKAYIDILKQVLQEGTIKPTRTGVDTLSITGVQFKHDMRLGFPLLTTKKMSLKMMATELEFFINGYSNKLWLQERDCHIWDDWCDPSIVPYGNDEETKERMKEQTSLGRIYGVQWRDWLYATDWKNVKSDDVKSHIGSIDQLKVLVDNLKKNPLDRRLLVTAWNPGELDQMALPPCHYAFQVVSDGTCIDLIWVQRSCDVPIGIPYDIGLYGILLTLLGNTAGLTPRYLVGQLGDTHIYMNQIEGVKEQIERQPKILPEIKIESKDLFTWTRDDLELIRYTSHPKIKYPIAV